MTRPELTSGIVGSPPQLARYGLRSDGTISVLPASGYYGTSWPSQNGSVIPQGISTGGWGLDGTTTRTFDRGYPQQTFLGASIRNFSMNGGFGDTSSTLSVDLVVDEYNDSDKTAQGLGDDVYHSGMGDGFVPPIVGSPVFFKFGTNFATVEQAYRRTFDATYSYNTLAPSTFTSAGGWDKNNFTELATNSFVNLEENRIYNFYNAMTGPGRGSGHIVFGGILQSYIQNRGPGGNPIYSVQVTDPREILSNVTILLNNYAGSTFSQKNLFNVYGFLEHNFSPATSGFLGSNYGPFNILTKIVNYATGEIIYTGSNNDIDPVDCWISPAGGAFGSNNPRIFPYTGTGMSRRGPQGIPYYRVVQAMNALFSINSNLPDEYKGYGGVINFRGYNYVVDFGGLPSLPPAYYFDFDQINLLDYALEVCEVVSRDLYVSLLPVINHPACNFIFNNSSNTFIHGIIRLDSIDRSKPPSYGSIKRYIDDLDGDGILVENQDVGYELSNVVTDKFVVGAQEVDMCFFSANADKDTASAIGNGGTSHAASSWTQWTLDTQVEQQILPYYGTLGERTVTIPKGWGSYQQVLLDTTGLNAQGVGFYYTTTEMELRCASVSYECWKNFLQQYNDIYLESIEEGDEYEGSVLSQTPNFGGVPPRPIASNYAVTVPRSVFNSYTGTSPLFGADNLPSSPCNPPYGYPLYYKRMTKLGIPEGGLTKLSSRITSMITGAAAIRGADAGNYEDIKNAQLAELEQINYGELSPKEKQFYDAIKSALQTTPPNVDLLNSLEEDMHKISAILPRLAKKGTENALKVYEFLKKVADENLGKKFLVKIPTKVNLSYSDVITSNGGAYTGGPFGFKPRPANTGTIGYEFSDAFQGAVTNTSRAGQHAFSHFLSLAPVNNNFGGALKSNYNPVYNKYEFNYSPTNQGGYFHFDLYENTFTTNQILNFANLNPEKAPMGVRQCLIPQDTTNFIDSNGRLSPYVRFDNSQYLALGSLSSDDYSQQVITVAGMVPDLCEFLGNAGSDTIDDRNFAYTSANASQRDNTTNLPKACAFVKCSVEEEFYMAPKLISRSMSVYGAVSDPKPKVSRPSKIFIPCSGWRPGSDRSDPEDLIPGTGCYIDSYRFIESTYVPTTGTAGETTRGDYEVSGGLITRQPDTRFVYALITLPNKVNATKDARYRDAMNQAGNTKLVQHYLTMDVVKGLPEFESIGYGKRGSSNPGAGMYFSNEVSSRAWLASKKAKYSMKFGFPYQMHMSAPSPVSPDLVVIPLISHERCYGPWISSQVDPQSSGYVNIGGRTEFIKDENLAPWNYAGYTGMNAAGVIQAQFANSLLLFSERGGFTFPGIPDRSLCQALLDGGPLVTNISVDVSEAGIKTTYKLDLYTASFGKLQKQKQDAIAQISRERQRLRDERNALIRKGLGKSQSSINVVGAINMFSNNGADTRNVAKNYLIATADSYTDPVSSPLGNNTVNTDYGISANQISQEELADSATFFGGERGNIVFNDQYNRTGGGTLSDIYMPYSDQYSEYMPNKISVNPETRNQIYEQDV